MMKRTLLVLAALGALVAGANAAVVISIGVYNPGATGALSDATSISSDGLLVGGSSVGPLYRMPVSWDATTGVMTDRSSAKGAGYLGGIDQKAGGALYVSANAGSTTYNAANFIGRRGNPALGVLMDHNNAGSNVLVGGNNSTSASADGLDSWIAGVHTSGTASKGNEGYIWKWSVGVSPFKTVNGTGKLQLKSVAANGRSVGADKGNTSPQGGTNKDRAVWVESGATTVQAIPNFAGNTGFWNSQGYGVSDDGNKFSGYMFPATSVGPRLEAFVWTQGTANAVMLMPAGGDLANEQAVAFDVTDDGTAVGYSWRTDTGNVGVIWLQDGVGGAYTNAKRLTEWLPTIGFYVGDWRSLGTATGIAQMGIGPNGHMQYAITGTGTHWMNSTHTTYRTEGYYIVIPEPGTMAFLVLGGLALLRRR